MEREREGESNSEREKEGNLLFCKLRLGELSILALLCGVVGDCTKKREREREALSGKHG